MCNCNGCKRGRLPHGGYQPCSKYELGPPPTVEYAYRPKARKDPDRTTLFELLPLCIFAFACGMAVGKYWL